MAAALLAPLLVLALLPALSSSAGADAISDKQAEAQQVADKLDQLNEKLMTLNSQYEVANQKLDDANHAIDQAQKRLDAANGDLASKRSELGVFAVNAYVAGNDPESFDAIISSDGAEAPIKSGYLQTLSGNRQDLIDQLAATKAQAEHEAQQLDEARAAAKAVADRVESARTQADAAVAEQHQIESRVQGELATLVEAERQRRAAEEEAKAKAAAEAAQAKAAQEAAARDAAARDAAARDAAARDAARRQVTNNGGGGGNVVPPPNPKPPIGPPDPPPTPNGGAARAVAAARSKLGSPYVWGAAGPSTFDCSGLIMWAWAQAGVSLPHYTGSQLAATRRIPMSDLAPGDLIFFWSGGETDPGHVGLYIGDGMMIHAPHTGDVVKLQSIYFWSGATMAAARVG